MDNTITATDLCDEIVVYEDRATVLAAFRDLSAQNRLFTHAGNKSIGYTESLSHWMLAMVLTPDNSTKPNHRVVFFPKNKFTERDVNNYIADHTQKILPINSAPSPLNSFTD